jgi:hypothetical protein
MTVPSRSRVTCGVIRHPDASDAASPALSSEWPQPEMLGSALPHLLSADPVRQKEQPKLTGSLPIEAESLRDGGRLPSEGAPSFAMRGTWTL